VNTGLVNPFARRGQGQNDKPPLTLRAGDLQALVDKAWARRDRWPAFREIARLADASNPDEGDLPALLHGYVDQDGLQPYVDAAVRDPRLWTHLGLAANHVDFIDFISRYASQHPSTRATTELFFLLDKMAQASFDAMVVLLDSDPTTDLIWTRTANREAYDSHIRTRAVARCRPSEAP
jgi:hypothetical protein